MAAIIRCDPLDGAWQTLGSGRYRGVVPEGIEATMNTWGPDQLSFTVKTVEAAALRPDLLPYTPVELEIDGILVWSGRVRQRPSTDQEHQVTCEGWQYHLDDDVYNRVYVHTRPGDYRDQRTFLTAQLGNFHVAGSVSNDNGTILLGWPNGAVVAIGSAVGVTLDLGVDSIGTRVVMDWESSNNDVNAVCNVRGTPTEDALNVTFNSAFSFALNTGASGTTAGTLGTGRRFMHIYVAHGTAGTIAADTHLRVKAIKVFRIAAYESGNASVITADTVITNALVFAPLLNQTSQFITAGSFAIPEYFTNDYQTPRDIMQSVNAYENYDLMIGGADLKTLIYQPKQTVPAYVVGEWSGAQFADASVAGEDIYNRAVVTGTGPDGATLVSKRTQTGTLVERNNSSAVRTKVLPIRSAGTSAVYDRFGDLWLADHQTSPFAGKLSATSGIRRWLGGSTVPPHELLLAANQRVHLSHRVDPDTGKWGRDGFIVGARYSHDNRSVDLDIDDRRDHFESILERYGILVDQILR